MVGRLNRRLRGWANYFDLATVRRAYVLGYVPFAERDVETEHGLATKALAIERASPSVQTYTTAPPLDSAPFD